METSELTYGAIKVSAGAGMAYFGLTLDQWVQLTGICMAVVCTVASLPAAWAALVKAYRAVRHGGK